MGLNNNQNNNSNAVYLNIVGGKITRRFKEHQPEVNGKPTTFEREIKDKDGNLVKKVIERYYDQIEGNINSAEIDTTGTYGAMLKFTIIDDEEYILSIPFDSSYGHAVMKKCPNIDPSKPVTFAPFNFESKTELKNGEPKKIVGCNIFQGNTKIPNAWTKENPGSLPAWEYSETLGKWSNDKFLEFLAAHFRNWANKIDPLTQSKVEKLADAIGAEVKMDMNPLEMEKEFAERKSEENNTNPHTNNDSGLDDLPF